MAHLGLALSGLSDAFRTISQERGLLPAAAVNRNVFPEVLLRQEAPAQVDLPLSAEGVLRCVWESRFGPMLIEVKGGRAYVNGQRVQPADQDAHAGWSS